MKKVLEGFVFETDIRYEDTEHGHIEFVGYELGCPTGRKVSNIFEQIDSISDEFERLDGELVRITIETIPLGSMDRCKTCTRRFKCLTRN